jgi:hypothetical protein
MSFKESPSSLNPEISADYLTLMKDKFKLQLTAFVADVLAVFRRYQTLSMQDDSLMLLDLETYTESVKTQLQNAAAHASDSCNFCQSTRLLHAFQDAR